MTDWRGLCAEVLAFNNGEGPYNFSGLKPYDRDNAAFDAWQDIRQRLKSALAQPEPEFTPEEIEMIQAPWSYLTPPQPEPEGLTDLTDEDLLRTYGLAKRDHCYEGPTDDWPKRSERSATACGLRAVIAADRARFRPAIKPELGEAVEVCEWLENHAAHLRKMQEIGALPETELQEMLGRAAALLQQQQHLLGLACAELDAFMEQQSAPAPVPKGLTDEELNMLAWKIYTGARDGDHRGAIALRACRAAIAADRARFGRPPIEPVPVGERWPEFSDCDQQERVWAWSPLLDHWKLTRLKRSIHTHCIPHWALPVPTSQEIP